MLNAQKWLDFFAKTNLVMYHFRNNAHITRILPGNEEIRKLSQAWIPN